MDGMASAAGTTGAATANPLGGAPPSGAPAPAGKGAHEVRHAQARIRLVAWTQDPYQLAVASARTCYAADFVFSGKLDRKGERTRLSLQEALPDAAAELAEIGRLDTPHPRRIQAAEALARQVEDPDTRNAVLLFADLARQRSEADARIAHSIYEAGHHTPFQHPTFVFALEGVSRNVVESFLHNHTFYNSEQQSQRYVEMKRAEVHVPASVRADPAALGIYEGAVQAAWGAYDALRERLTAANARTMAAIGRIKGQSEAEAGKEAEKKAQEMARYVIPIAAATQLYHTVSGIVLLRYLRMSQAQNAAGEARAMVDAMLAEVERVDSAFARQVRETPWPRESLPEWGLLDAQGPAPFPMPPGQDSFLVNATPHAPGLVADVVREVTGTTADEQALLARVLDPAKNPVWNDTLNTWDHSPVLRSLRHVHYTFRKRLSLTAYAQDQRHRLTPGARPLLQRCLTPEPDVHVPDSVAADSQSRAIYDGAMRALWSAIAALRSRGIPDEDAVYLLPNATHLYFHQSGDLLSFIHKWRLRLCFNAQKEIFDASLAELRQAQDAHPELTRWLGPPCTFVAAAQPADRQDDVAACCPEGPRWCGVKVWKNFDAARGIPKRPY